MCIQLMLPPNRFGENDNLDRRGMHIYNKTYFRCGGVYLYKVKFPVESKVFNNCKKLQSVTKYLRLTLDFDWNSALREKFDLYFSRVFY